MNSSVEAPFNLDQTVQRWNKTIITGDPIKAADVEDLARDTVRLVANIYHVVVEELRDGEEIAWGDKAGYVGLSPNGEAWISIGYTMANVRTVLQGGANPNEIADFLWKGAMLKHRASPKLAPYRASIDDLLKPVVR